MLSGTWIWRAAQHQVPSAETPVSGPQVAVGGETGVSPGDVKGQGRARADLSYEGRTPRELLHLLGQSDARLVRSGRDLLNVILRQLEDLQLQLTQRSRSRNPWNLTGDHGTPKNENDITNEIVDRLKARLNAPGVLDREVEVTPSRRGIGTRIDLKATVPTAAYPPGMASVIIEAKLATNSSLMTKDRS